MSSLHHIDENMYSVLCEVIMDNKQVLSKC